ncbi:hypothetical protein GWK47_032333 [Chionoecetes opilio]|uniref:Uncharacterized protein n=1 Tax=Chionoecetes opilio TaxID=41210 RepID=A0A8J4YI21_CHIOP|nr:hypothetical protein GWK47_032333 [Chionoecetes opilio]
MRKEERHIHGATKHLGAPSLGLLEYHKFLFCLFVGTGGTSGHATADYEAQCCKNRFPSGENSGYKLPLIGTGKSSTLFGGVTQEPGAKFPGTFGLACHPFLRTLSPLFSLVDSFDTVVQGPVPYHSTLIEVSSFSHDVGNKHSTCIIVKSMMPVTGGVYHSSTLEHSNIKRPEGFFLRLLGQNLVNGLLPFSSFPLSAQKRRGWGDSHA